MEPYRRNLVRLALAMHAEFSQAQTHLPTNLRLPAVTWENCQDLWRQIHLANHRGWHLAAALLQAEFKSALSQLGHDAFGCEQAVRVEPPPKPASPSEFFADLLALNQEFGGLTYELSTGTLSVVTDQIELEGIFLGSFTIELTWKNFDPGERAYRIIANDPHPAATDDDITHPHVSDGILCEGNAQLSIQAALKQGRIGDFFLIVNRLLHTYNASSPHVHLENWGGTKCGDCGSYMNQDQIWECQACGTSICDDCRRSCDACESSHCNECIKTCHACEVDLCRHCHIRCTKCEEGYCRPCHQESHTHEENHEETRAKIPAR